ncbi:MAG: hypothetical protein ACRD1T_17600, partial [Acidimicrobiia bacterium]
MRKAFLVALFVLPLFLSPAWAAPEQGRQLVKAIHYLGSDEPNVNIVSPQHLPVPSASSKIGPGAYLLLHRPDGSFLCTANFIWRSGPVLYVGAAGHCFLQEGKTSTHGPGADYDPALTRVEICISNCTFGGQLGAIFGDFLELGRVVYARQTRDGEDVGNDFGIVEIPASVPWEWMDPSIPVWGGPSSIEDVSRGARVCLYGNGTGSGETFATKARTGLGQDVSSSGDSWSALIPSTPGDSGSAVVTCDPAEGGFHGRGAAGILTHFGLSGEVFSIFGTTTRRAADMA